MHYFIFGGVEPKGKFGRLFLDTAASSIQEVNNLGEPIAKPALLPFLFSIRRMVLPGK